MPVTLLVSIAPALVAGEHVDGVPPLPQPLSCPRQGQVTAPVLCFSPCAGAVSALPVTAQGCVGWLLPSSDTAIGLGLSPLARLAPARRGDGITSLWL